MLKGIGIPIIDWRITSYCNNNCHYCYASERFGELTRKDIFLLIERIVEFGCERVCISGGEPLLCQYTLDVIKELHNNDISVYLSTNGTDYIEKRKFIEPYITKLSLPLDGYDESSNAINGREYSGFSDVIEILELYKAEEHKFAIKIGTVLTKKNLKKIHFDNIYNILKNYPIDMWKIYEFIPEEKGVENVRELQIKLSELEVFLSSINDILHSNIMNVIFAKRKSRNSAYFIIRPDGKVILPVDRKIVNEKILGNLLTETLEDILERWYKYIIIENVEDTVQKRNGIKGI